MTEQVITFEAMEQAANLFGSFDENIKLLEREYGVTITCRGADLKVVCLLYTSPSPRDA